MVDVEPFLSWTLIPYRPLLSLEKMVVVILYNEFVEMLSEYPIILLTNDQHFASVMEKW
jgi:hypothetical protein